MVADVTYGEADRRVLLIADGDPAATRLEIEQAGWPVATAVTPAGLAALLRDGPGYALAVLDTAAVADDRLHDVVAQVADALGPPLVILAAPAQLDAVAYAAPTYTVLASDCQTKEYPFVLTTAALTGGARSGSVRETDGERLARLNAEITRIAELLTRLANPEPEQTAERTITFEQPSSVPAAGLPSALIVRDAIRARRMRDRFLGANLFVDPAWDMLLDLFAADLEGTRVSVFSLCIAAAVPPTTALRWITMLSDFGLIVRAADPEDRRRAFLSLSPRGRDGMRRYAAALHDAGLPFA